MLTGKNVNAANELQTIIGSHHPGDEISLKVFRDGKTFDKSVILKPRDEQTNQTAENLDTKNNPK